MAARRLLHHARGVPLLCTSPTAVAAPSSARLLHLPLIGGRIERSFRERQLVPYSPQQARRLWAHPLPRVWHPCADSLLVLWLFSCTTSSWTWTNMWSSYPSACACALHLLPLAVVLVLHQSQPPSSTAPTQWQPRHQAHESNDVRGGALRRLPVAQVRPTALWHRTLQLADTPSYCGLQGDILVAGARRWTLHTHRCSLGGATHVTDGCGCTLLHA